MHLMYFTEQPMSAYDASEGLKYGATALTFSNKHFDPVAGSRLYNEYLEQYVYAEEVGIDGIMRRMRTTPASSTWMIDRSERILCASTLGTCPCLTALRHDRNAMVGMIDTRPMMMNSDSLAMKVQVWK